MCSEKIFRLAIILIFAATPLNSVTYTNKTFLISRSVGSEISMQQSLWYANQRNAENLNNCRFGGSIQATAFYQKSYCGRELGRYFGIAGKNDITYGRIHDRRFFDLDINAVVRFYVLNKAVAAPSVLALPAPYTPANYLHGKLEISPQKTQLGCCFDYYNKLPFFNKKLFLKLSFPFAKVRNSLRSTVYSEHVGHDHTNFTDFLSGKYSYADAANFNDHQEALKFAKIDGRKRSHFGLSDVRGILGCSIINSEEYDANSYVFAVAPCGNKPTGEFLFEPIVGNGKHWGVGVGFEHSIDIYKNEKFSVEHLGQIRLTKFFESDEIRTLQTLVDLKASLAWNHYFLVGVHGLRGVRPLANVSTRPVKVNPGFQLEGSFSIGVRKKTMLVDFGYSFLAREAENIKVKSWEDGKVAFAGDDFDNGATFNVNNPAHLGGVIDISPINRDELNLEEASAPASILHQIFLGLGYESHDLLSWPLVFGVGVSSEWQNSNSSVPTRSIWLKTSLAF